MVYCRTTCVGEELHVPNKTYPQEEKTELIVAAARGDREAFGKLYEQYHPKVFRHILCLVNNHHIAEDLASQTFLKALGAIHRYEARGVPFLAWLLRIAYNLGVNYKRTQGNHVDRLPQSDLPDDQRHPDMIVEATDNTKRIREMIMGLEDNRRSVIVMFFLEDLSLSDIASVLGKSIGAVRALKCRALQ